MPQQLIECYKAIEDGSARMLAAAQEEDWDGVLRCEGACAVLIEQLRSRANSEELDEASRFEKAKIMMRILKNDAQIRNLAEAGLDHFSSQGLDGPRTLH